MAGIGGLPVHDQMCSSEPSRAARLTAGPLWSSYALGFAYGPGRGSLPRLMMAHSAIAYRVGYG